VLTQTGRGHHALDAVPGAVAHRAPVLVAGVARRERRVRRHARDAGVGGALLIVVGHVRVLVRYHPAARAVALVLLAVARRLHRRRRASGHQGHAASSIGALAGLAVVILTGAIHRVQAAHARAVAVADQVHAAHRPGRERRVG